MVRPRRRAGLVVFALSIQLSSCAPGRVGSPPRLEAIRLGPRAGVVIAAATEPPAPPCVRRSVAAIPRPVEGETSSSVVLVALGEKRLAYVADEEDRALRVVDLESGAEIGATELGAAPSDLLVLPDGRVAVSLPAANEVAIFEPGADLAAPFGRRCRASVAAEPLGMARAKDGASIFVASRWGHALTGLDSVSLDRRFALDLPRDPRSVVLSNDGRSAFVSHVSGGLISVVPVEGDGPVARTLEVRLETLTDEPLFVGMMPPRDFTEPPGTVSGPARRVIKQTRFGGQGYALARGAEGRIFAAHTLARPRPVGSSGGYGGGGISDPPVVADVGVIEGDAKLAVPHVGPLTFSDCLLPRAAAVDDAHGRLLVACRGLDSVLTYDATAAHPHDREIGRVKVGAGPDGIAVDAFAGVAYVWSAFDRTLAEVSTEVRGKKNQPRRTIAIARRSPAPSDEVARGRALFFNANAMRIAADGRSCASCHPDGRDDGLTWTTQEGPRQTPMLAGRLDDTAPFGWDGARTSLLSHLSRTLERLRGTGIDEAERKSLFAYIATMKTPRSTAKDDPVVDRGKDIFESDQAGCSGCHAGGASTDGLRHDVRSRAPLDSHAAFDTPSLRFISRTAPFFHDGRFRTMRELLVGSDGKMGQTAHLSPGDLDALEAYLETL